MSAVLTEMITLITDGLVAMGTGIGKGLGGMVESIFLEVGTNGEITGLSTFGGVVLIFAGVSLAIGLSKWVTNWVSSLGN